MVEYLGTVNNIITTKQLSTLTGATSGTVLQSGDITWLLYNVDNTQILVANKLIKSTISYDLLNDLNLVEGKEITIGNATFICRLLSGGNSSSGGGEWDEFIVNFASEDEISNWKNYWTWCKETVGTGAVARGSSSVSAWTTYTKSSSGTGLGWRPVLEVKIPPLANSIQSQNLGNKTSWSNLSYTITGDTHSLVEKLDGTIIRSLGNQASGTEYTLDLSQQWDSISYGKHTIEIIATDSNNLSSIVTITFNKIKEITKPIATESSLKEFVDHIGNIDKDIDYLRYKLYDNLIEKGVECSDTDKMSSLINKILTMRVLGNPYAGNNYTIYSKNTIENVYGTNYIVVDEFTFFETGTFRYSFVMKPINTSSAGYALLQICRDGVYEDVKTFQTNGFYEITHTIDIDVKNGDIICLKLKTNGKSYGCDFLKSTIKCNYEIL